MKSRVKKRPGHHPESAHKKNPRKEMFSESDKPANVSYIQSPIQLTISVLVSNSKHTIRQCLESIKPLLDKIPSELIVVDTGSIDGSVEIAKEYTDNVISFPWKDDFAAARNVGLEKAQGEWFMFIDDDEWFEDISPLIRFFQFRECDGYARAAYIQRNYVVKDGSAHNDLYLPRVARRTKQLRFEGRVYESLSPAYSPVKFLDCFVHHYGLTPDDGQLRRKTARNIPLLEREVEDHPNELRYYVQLVRELMTAENFDRAIEVAEKTLEIPKKLWRQLEMSWIIAAVVSCYFQKEEYEKCVDVSTGLLASGILTELAVATIRYDRMLCFDQLDKHEETITESMEFLSTAKSLVENPAFLNRQRYLYLDTVLSESSVLYAQYNMAKHLCVLERYSDALEACEGMYYADMQLPEPLAYFLWQTFCQSGLIDQIEKFYRKCNGRSDSLRIFAEQAEAAKERFPELAFEIVKAMSKIDDKTPYLSFCRIIVALDRGDIAVAKWEIEWFMQNEIPCVSPYDAVMPIAMSLDMDIAPLVKAMSDEQWDACITAMKDDPSAQAADILSEYIEKHADKLSVNARLGRML